MLQGRTTAITDVLSKENLGVILTREFGITLNSEQLSTLYEGYCKNQAGNDGG